MIHALKSYFTRRRLSQVQSLRQSAIEEARRKGPGYQVALHKAAALTRLELELGARR